MSHHEAIERWMVNLKAIEGELTDLLAHCPDCIPGEIRVQAKWAREALHCGPLRLDSPTPPETEPPVTIGNERWEHWRGALLAATNATTDTLELCPHNLPPELRYHIRRATLSLTYVVQADSRILTRELGEESDDEGRANGHPYDHPL